MFQDIFSHKTSEGLTDLMSIKNPMLIPKIRYISVNMGLGPKLLKDNKVLSYALDCLSIISGQKSVPTFAKKSISSFKVREKMILGCKVTIRNKKNINNFFLKTLIALSRSRDFVGIKRTQFDGLGNCSFGIDDHTVYPDIDYDKSFVILGMNINIITNLANDQDGVKFLSYLNLPFIKHSE